MAITATKKVIEKITTEVEKIVNDDPHSMHTMEPLDEWRQGDVRIIRLPDDFDLQKHCNKESVIPTKLAPGTTRGSRHCLDSIEGVTAYVLRQGNFLDGPVLHLSEPRTITHPEHGDCVGLPVGIYAFPGQRVRAEEIRRTRD